LCQGRGPVTEVTEILKEHLDYLLAEKLMKTSTFPRVDYSIRRKNCIIWTHGFGFAMSIGFIFFVLSQSVDTTKQP
jgi:predicted membrane channel-forming protein YqfA (hemolysin III family)